MSYRPSPSSRDLWVLGGIKEELRDLHGYPEENVKVKGRQEPSGCLGGFWVK